MIEFDDVLYNFVQGQLKEKAEIEREELANAYRSGSSIDAGA